MLKTFLQHKKKLFTLLLAVWGIHFYMLLPTPLFNTAYSKLLFSNDNKILSVLIASDEQWRFPLTDKLSDKYKTCVINFEDEKFYYHPGINPLSIARATVQNIKNKRVKSGGSTITMQVIRLSKNNPPRSIWEKLKEVYVAIRLECSYSKEEILNLYASNAPFGGNIVGITAAGWKYFGRPLHELSWAEAATLAVLPNSPSLIFPGKNNHLLKLKRDRLLQKLVTKAIIDQQTYSLAIDEPLPSHFIDFPNKASHALVYLKQKYPLQHIFKSTLNSNLQYRGNALLKRYADEYAQNHIYNGAILIIDNRTQQVLSYIGNTTANNGIYHENYVDVIQAPRSTGSILKPFLHAAAIDDGLILNTTILPDIPTIIQGFAPKNYTKSFEGAVKANTALARSLNIPAVLLLKEYGYPLFHDKMKKVGLSTLTHNADHYGLSLILGGAEATLWDLGKLYSGMAKTLNHFEKAPLNKSYDANEYQAPLLLKTEKGLELNFKTQAYFSASAIFETFESLLELNRPTEEGDWRQFENSKKIAWKTGTSHGFRDAWAVGVTPNYTVAVWIGNASGEGRPGLVGVSKAAPVLFSVFNLLPNELWFKAPNRELFTTTICRQSGQKSGENCSEIDSVTISTHGKQTKLCSYCKTFFVNEKGLQVNSSCYPVAKMKQQKQFVLPPIQEWYYLQKSANYTRLPLYDKHCTPNESEIVLNIIYPYDGAKIYIPRQLEGERSTLICDATHKNKHSKIYWHLNDVYLGETTNQHHMAIEYKKGKQLLMIVDENGNQEIIKFEIL